MAKDNILKPMVSLLLFKVIIILAPSKMDSSMDLERKLMPMEISTMEILLMDFLKAMENIYGLIKQYIKETSNKDIEMDMESGNHPINDKNILDISYSIKSMDMESGNLVIKCTKETMWKEKDVEKDSNI